MDRISSVLTTLCESETFFFASVQFETSKPEDEIP